MFDLFDVWLILIMIKKSGKEKNACVQKETSFDDVVNVTTSYLSHIFRANWQHGKMTLPRNRSRWLLLIFQRTIKLFLCITVKFANDLSF